MIGLVAGVGAIVFYSAIRIAAAGLLGGGAGYRPPLPAGEGVTVTMPIGHPWLVILVLVLGGLLSGLLVFLLAPEAEGHGTDAAIAAFHRGTPVRAGSPLVGKTLRDLQLPGGSLVVAVQRGRDTLIPHGNTRLQAGDVLTLAVQRDFEAEVRRVLAATAGA